MQPALLFQKSFATDA